MRMWKTKIQAGPVIWMRLSKETPVQRSTWALLGDCLHGWRVWECVRLCVLSLLAHKCGCVSMHKCVCKCFVRLFTPQNGSQWTSIFRSGPCRWTVKEERRWWGFVAVGRWDPAGTGQSANEEPSEASIHLEHGPLQLPWPWLWSTKMLDPHHSPRATSLPSGQHTCIFIRSMFRHPQMYMHVHVCSPRDTCTYVSTSMTSGTVFAGTSLGYLPASVPAVSHCLSTLMTKEEECNNIMYLVVSGRISTFPS